MPNEFQSVSDEELARQTQAGSQAAFEQLVYRYEYRLYGFVAQFCGRGPEARDITQESFVKAYQAIAQFNPRHTFAAWLFTIARRKCIDHYRASRPHSGEPVPELSDLNDPAAVLEAQEQRRDLWQTARRLLPPAQFQALWLKYVEEMSVAQIARVLRKSQTHIKVMLFRARLTLGRELANPQHGCSDLWGRAVHAPAAAAARPARFTPSLLCL